MKKAPGSAPALLISRLRAACLDHPVAASLLAAALVRVMAVFTAQGFMASDDYFVYLHIPWVWSHGGNEWFDMDHPSGFSIVYPGLNYLSILAMRAVGLVNPDHMMYVNRALHAAWSMLGVWYAVRILARATSDARVLLGGGMLAAFVFIFPYASVRNLPEMVCVPFVMMSLFHAERALSDNRSRDALIAGLAIGASFVIRYQSLAFAPAAGLLFLLHRQWKAAVLFTLGALVLLAFQGTVDLVAYGRFFAAPIQYFGYNLQHSSEYVVGPWYRYLLLLIGIFIPPFSVLFLASAAFSRKKLPVVFWSTLLFLVVYSITPAKQERFVIPALMPLALLGAIGMAELMQRNIAAGWRRAIGGGWKFFWVINTAIMLLFLIHYGKRGQIEALNYLYQRGDAQGVLVDRTDFDTWLPNFYLDIPRDNYFWVSSENDWAALAAHVSTGHPKPRYGLILVPKDINEHLQRFAQHGVTAHVLARFGPGPLEWILAQLNPKYNSTNDVYVVELAYNGEG